MSCVDVVRLFASKGGKSKKKKIELIFTFFFGGTVSSVLSQKEMKKKKIFLYIELESRSDIYCTSVNPDVF